MSEQETKQPGIKYDTDKPRWDLLPLDIIEELVKILTHGSKKYADNNWKFVRPFRNRYFAAMMRHIKAWQKGEVFDKESGLPTMAHVMCNVMFLLWADLYLDSNEESIYDTEE